MCRLSNSLARWVWSLKSLKAKSHPEQRWLVSKIEDSGDLDIRGHESARRNKVATHPVDAIN